jgi:hypothetical protein
MQQNKHQTHVSVHLMIIGIVLIPFAWLKKQEWKHVQVQVNVTLDQAYIVILVIAFVSQITFGIHHIMFVVNMIFRKYFFKAIFLVKFGIKVKNLTYGESCTMNPCDGSLLLTCGVSQYCVCQGSLFWNGTYCSNKQKIGLFLFPYFLKK